MNTVNIRILEDQLKTTAADYERYLVEERAHLERLKREPPAVVWTVDYMELLTKYSVAQYVHYSTCRVR